MTIHQALGSVMDELNCITVKGKADMQHMLTAMNLIEDIQQALIPKPQTPTQAEPVDEAPTEE